jgi:hypothetical protein
VEICCEIGVKLLTMIALASFLIAIVCGLLWMGLVAPAILRFFGVPVAIGDWMLERRNQRLSRTQYIWAGGVFQWGVGMFVFFTLSKYLEWRLLGDRFSYLSLTPVDMIVWLLSWLAVGWLFGVWTAPHREGTDLSGR